MCQTLGVSFRRSAPVEESEKIQEKAAPKSQEAEALSFSSIFASGFTGLGWMILDQYFEALLIFFIFVCSFC